MSGPLTRRALAGLPDDYASTEPYDEPEDVAQLPTLGQYLTAETGCVTIGVRESHVYNQSAPPGTIEDRRTKMATTQSGAATKPAGLTPAQVAAQERAKAKAIELKEKMAAKAAATKAKEQADAAKAKAKELATKEAEKAKLAKAKEAEKLTAEKAKAKAAADAARIKAKAEKEAAALKAKAEREAERAKRKAEREAAGLKDRMVPADLSHYTKDTEKKTPGGNASVDINDKLANELRGLTLDQVYSKASKVLKEPVDALTAKYAHLNPGMQRMNLGNRMRAAQAKQETK